MLLSTMHTVKTVYQRTWWFPILKCWYSEYTGKRTWPVSAAFVINKKRCTQHYISNVQLLYSSAQQLNINS